MHNVCIYIIKGNYKYTPLYNSLPNSITDWLADSAHSASLGVNVLDSPLVGLFVNRYGYRMILWGIFDPSPCVRVVV